MVSLWSGQIEAGTAANTAYQALKKIGCKAHMWPGSQAEVPCFSLPYTQQTAPLVQAPVFWPTPPRFTVVFQVLDAKNIQLQDFKDWAAPKVVPQFFTCFDRVCRDSRSTATMITSRTPTITTSCWRCR